MTRRTLGLSASALAGLAAVVASEADPSIVPFFIGLVVIGGLEASMAQSPYIGARRRVARGLALLWLGAASWIGLLLVMENTVWQASAPTAGSAAAYLGVPATAYHLLGLFGGLLLILASALGPDRWFDRR